MTYNTTGQITNKSCKLYCFNGGQCTECTVETMPSHKKFTCQHCACTDEFKGDRCEERQTYYNSLAHDPSAAVIGIVVFLIICIIIGAAYLLWKRRAVVRHRGKNVNVEHQILSENVDVGFDETI